MKNIFLSITVALLTMVLMLSIGVDFSQASERVMDKGQKVNKGMMEKDKMAKEVETLIKTGKMIEEEGRKTNDKTMITNGQLMIKQGQMMKEGKWPQ
ncbi:MAG: hypothetical protein IH628_03935 [Proteobacteria bacterium]|nr:hypothetical protein [Pseudomonadota bacterium]